MDGAAPHRNTARPAGDENGWRDRLVVNRETMRTLRQHTARVTLAIAATERMVAGTLRLLAAQDRLRGRTAAADRREARARDADRFAAQESAAAGKLNQQTSRSAATRSC